MTIHRQEKASIVLQVNLVYRGVQIYVRTCFLEPAPEPKGKFDPEKGVVPVYPLMAVPQIYPYTNSSCVVANRYRQNLGSIGQDLRGQKKSNVACFTSMQTTQIHHFSIKNSIFLLISAFRGLPIRLCTSLPLTVGQGLQLDDA